MEHCSTDGRFLTVDCLEVWIDEPGDITVRPIAPERLAHARAVRERILAEEAANKQDNFGKESP
jgi:hypothetical protein